MIVRTLVACLGLEHYDNCTQKTEPFHGVLEEALQLQERNNTWICLDFIINFINFIFLNFLMEEANLDLKIHQYY